MPGLTRLTNGALVRALGRLRFPGLFVLTGVVFLVDLVIPDAIPLVDEIFLVLLTTLLGSVKKRRTPDQTRSRS